MYWLKIIPLNVRHQENEGKKCLWPSESSEDVPIQGMSALPYQSCPKCSDSGHACMKRAHFSMMFNTCVSNPGACSQATTQFYLCKYNSYSIKKQRKGCDAKLTPGDRLSHACGVPPFVTQAMKIVGIKPTND